MGILRTVRARAATLVLLGATLFATASGAEDAAPLRIVGSGYSMPVLMRPWVEAFTARTGVAVEVVPSGTSTGPPALIEGRADIAAMTRPLREAEAKALRARFGVDPISLPVARDEVAIFVNDANPLERMTLAQIDAVYSRDRLCGAPEDIVRWGQLGLGGEYVDRAIALFGRRPGSGTGVFFRSRALCGGDFKDWMRISPGQASASLRVVESRFGIGFGSLRDLRPGMKVVAVAIEDDGPYVRPGQGDAASAYPLARTFDFVVPRREPQEQHPALVEFLSSVLSPEAQASATTAGYSPLTTAQRVRSLDQTAVLEERNP